MRSAVLANLERDTELPLVGCAAEHGGPAIPARILGPGPEDVAVGAATRGASADAGGLRALIDARTADIHRWAGV